MDKEMSRSAIKEQRDTNELLVVMEVIKKGELYWQEMLQKSVQDNLLTAVDLNCLREIITFVHRGNIPCSASGKVPAKTMALVNNALLIEAKLNDEGVLSYFDADDDIDELTLTNYKMH